MGAAYLVVALGVLEGASMVLPVLGLGPRVFNALVVLSLVGFPLAVGLAWTFDLTASGIRRTAPLAEGGAPAADRWVRLKAVLMGAGFMGVVWLGVSAWQQPLTDVEPPGGPGETRPTLAVLPLTDLSPGGERGYVADGLHEEILHHLAQIQGVRLTSRTSSLFFRGVPGEIAGDSLGAQYVLEGSLRTAGDSILLTVQLIDAVVDEHLWSEEMGHRFTVEGLFALQEGLAKKVAASLTGTLVGESGTPRSEPPTSNMEAYNEYLRGVYQINQFTVLAWWQAVEHFERAVRLDPEFGLGHAWLASTLAYLNNFGDVTQGRLFGRMRQHAELAVRYGAEDDPRVLLAQMAYLWPQDFAWDEARRVIERVLEIDPNHVDAMWYLAEWHGLIEGNTERALDLIGQARRLDPFSPRLYMVQVWVLMAGGRFAEASEVLQGMLAYDPRNLDVVQGLATALSLSGRVEEARPLVDRILELQPRPYPPTLAAHIARAGATDRARQILEASVSRKESGGSVASSGIAAGYAALGDIDLALDWLERSFEEEGGVYYLRSFDYAPLAGQPRFQALWDKVGLRGRHWALDREAVADGG